MVSWGVLVVVAIVTFFIGMGIAYFIWSTQPVILQFDSPNYMINHSGEITLTNHQANHDSNIKDKTPIHISSDSDPGFILMSTETGENTGSFSNSIILTLGSDDPSNGILHAEPGDKIHAIYGGLSSEVDVLADTGGGMLASSTMPVTLSPFIIYDQSHGEIRVFDPAMTSQTTLQATINSTVDITGFSVTLHQDSPGSSTFTSNMITFSASASVSDPTNLILKIPSVATSNAVKATYGSNFMYSTVSITPILQVVTNPDVTVGLTCPAGGDLDNDGICDSWEVPGTGLVIPYNGITFAVPSTGTCNTNFVASDPLNANRCPDPGRPDVYVQVSWMDGHLPDTKALSNVVNAFDQEPVKYAQSTKSGITLHILVDALRMPFAESIPLDGSNLVPTQTGFRQLKSQFFLTPNDRAQAGCATSLDDCATAKRQVFHHAQYIHNLSDTPFSSGWSEILGNDFIVSLGNFTGQVGSTNQQAGTFMHELGHNLNLNHGGTASQAFNCKPPYLSLMNYLYQFNAANGGFLTSRPLDYSHSRIVYFENALDEQAGIPASDPPGLSAAIAGIRVDGTHLNSMTVPTGQILAGQSPWADFNQNNARETATYQQNTHYFGIPDCTDTTIKSSMGGNDDWNSINFYFKSSSNYANGVYTDPNAEHEITGIIVKQIFSMTGATPDPPSNMTVALRIILPTNATIDVEPFTQNGTIDDPISKSFTGTVDYGDGSSIETLDIEGKSFVLSHTYDKAGSYTVTVSISNDRGGNSTAIVNLK